MATWFAQNSSVNIDSVNQWNSAANGSGSWLTWASLGASDILVANGKTSITINVSFTCATITTAATGGTAGGGFLLAAGVTVTANVTAGTTVCINRTASGAESFIVGNVTGGPSSNAHGVHNNSTATITITGNIVGGAGGFGLRNETTGLINVTGNITADAIYGLANISTGNVTITGNVTGGTGTGGAGSGVYNVTTATITITGNVIGGTVDSAYGVRNDSTGSISISGTITAGTGARAHGLYSPASAICYLLGGTVTANADGFAGVVSSRPLIHASATVQHTYRVNNAGVAGVARSLYTGGTNIGQPSTANVRLGTTFGAASEYTGTLAVPSPTLVAIGVATDNTVGSYAPSGGATAADIADAVWDEVRSGHTTAGTFGEKVTAGLDSASVTAVQTGLATSASITTLRGADNDTLKTLSDQIDGISSGGTDWTANERTAIRSILGVPASGTTPADPTVGILDTIRDSVGTYIAGIAAVASTTTGTIVGFPSSLNIGDSYTEEANSDIHVFIRDENDDPITAVGDFNFTDPEFAPEVNITQSGSTGRVKAVVTFVNTSPEDYLKVEIPTSQSRRASPGTATIQCLLKWVDTEGKVLAQKTLTKQAVTWNEMV